MLGWVPFMVALAVAPNPYVLLPPAFASGMAVEQFGIAWETSMQRHIPGDVLARVYSYDMLGSFVAIPLGQLAAGPAALAFGAEATILAAAGIVLVATLAMVASRDVRRLPAEPEQPAATDVEGAATAAGLG